MGKLVLSCPQCHKILYEVEEAESFVVAGKCAFCEQELIYKTEKQRYEAELKEQ